MAIPWPIPVVPSSSRRITARTMSGRSVSRKYPAVPSAATISAMTCCFTRRTAAWSCESTPVAVALRLGIIASRTRKLVNLMRWPPRRGRCRSRLLHGSCGRAPVVRRIPAVVLELFLVMFDLLYDAVGGEVERVAHLAVLVDRDELVFVLGVRDDLDRDLSLALAVAIHRDRDGRQAVEVVEQLFGLLVELLLGVVTQVPVAGGDCHLHGEPRVPFRAAGPSPVPPACDLGCGPVPTG